MLKIALAVTVLLMVAFLLVLTVAVRRGCTVVEVFDVDVSKYTKVLDRFRRK